MSPIIKSSTLTLRRLAVSWLDLLIHVLNFVAPALAVAALLALVLAVRTPRVRQRPVAVWGGLAALGSFVLLGGLLYFGRDGKMATYAALVLAQGAFAAWWARR
jgi:hypothetical protein